eukprot:m.238145 g.238145  ORF g.238145 m.238145 type:complete len:104 (+) comp26564_c0_seq1:931-1242(+)
MCYTVYSSMWNADSAGGFKFLVLLLLPEYVNPGSTTSVSTFGLGSVSHGHETGTKCKLVGTVIFTLELFATLLHPLMTCLDQFWGSSCGSRPTEENTNLDTQS